MTTFSTVEISDPQFMPPGLTHITVKSAALQRRADLTCYIPASAAGEKTLPLVILLHGVYGSHWAWTGKGGAHRVLDDLVGENAVPPMMLAMPSDGLFGDGSGYVRHQDADYATWIVEEVPAAAALLDGRVLASPKFITGLSMGGYGALRLGALHPHTFRAFSGMSSVTSLDYMERFVAASGHEYVLHETKPLSLLDCFLTQKSELRPFRFDCGTEDILLEENRALHQALTEAHIPHKYAEHAGAHEWTYWHQHLADQLRFFADHC